MLAAAHPRPLPTLPDPDEIAGGFAPGFALGFVVGFAVALVLMGLSLLTVTLWWR